MKIRTSKIISSDKKLAELILLISMQSEGDEKFGATKLNKLLFHCDFSAYLNFNVPITGQEYFALREGPAPRRLVPVSRGLQRRGHLVIRKQDYFGRIQNRPIALRPPNVSIFKPREINLVNYTLNRFRDFNATEISRHSHLFIGWRVAREKETIPYSTALIDLREPTIDERDRGLKLEALAKKALRRHARPKDAHGHP